MIVVVLLAAVMELVVRLAVVILRRRAEAEQHVEGQGAMARAHDADAGPHLGPDLCLDRLEARVIDQIRLADHDKVGA